MKKGSDSVELVTCSTCGAHATFKIGGVAIDFSFLAVRHIADAALARLQIDEDISPAGYQEGVADIATSPELYESRQQLEEALLNGRKMDKYLEACHRRDDPPHNLRMEMPRRYEPSTLPPASEQRKGKSPRQRARI